MAGRETQPFIETMGRRPRFVRGELHQGAPPPARLFERPLHHRGPDPLAPQHVVSGFPSEGSHTVWSYDALP